MALLNAGCRTAKCFDGLLPRDGWSHASADEHSGLTWIWVERQSVLVTAPGTEAFVIFPGNIAVLDARAGVAIKPLGSGILPWVYCANWPTTVWLNALMIKPGTVAHIPIVHEKAYPALLALRNTLAEETAIPSAEKAALITQSESHELPHFILSNLLQCMDASPLALLVGKGRFSSEVSKELLAESAISLVDDIAARCAMSRSTFSAKFRRLTGYSYLEFMTAWRMNLSSLRFQFKKATAAQEAERYGYQSQAAYRKAFSRSIGKPPGLMRRSKTAGHTAENHTVRKQHLRSIKSIAANRSKNTTHVRTQIDVFQTPPELEKLILKVLLQL